MEWINPKSNFNLWKLICKSFAVNCSLKPVWQRHHQMLVFIPVDALPKKKKKNIPECTALSCAQASYTLGDYVWSFLLPSPCTSGWLVNCASNVTGWPPFTPSACPSPSMLCCSHEVAGGCWREFPSISTCISWGTVPASSGSSADGGCNCWASSYLIWGRLWGKSVY